MPENADLTRRTEQALVCFVEEFVGVTGTLTVDQPLFDQGSSVLAPLADSLTTTELVLALEESLGISLLDLNDLEIIGTVHRLAAFLGERADPSALSRFLTAWEPSTPPPATDPTDPDAT